MKKLLPFGLVCIALFAVAATPKWTPQSFINGTYVSLTNNTTWNYNTMSNVWFWDYSRNTNVNSGMTNGNIGGFTGRPAFVFADIFPDANGGVQANASVYLTMGVCSNYYPLPKDMSGAMLSTNYSGIFTNSTTNSLTITFAAVTDGQWLDGGLPIGAAKIFTWTFVGTNAAPGTNFAQTFSTNLPSTFLQGTAKIGVQSIVVGNSPAANQGVTIDAFGINQIAP